MDHSLIKGNKHIENYSLMKGHTHIEEDHTKYNIHNEDDHSLLKGKKNKQTGADYSLMRVTQT